MKNEEIKTLATCTDIEFLKQTNKVRHAVEEWLTATDIANIRKRMPEYEAIPDDKEEAEAVRERNKELQMEQAKKNLDAMLDAMLEEHPEETLKVIRLCCFVEPDDDTHKVTYYLGAFSEMLGDKEVLRFFTSLMSLAQTFGLKI